MVTHKLVILSQSPEAWKWSKWFGKLSAKNNTRCAVKYENICPMSLGVTNKLSITYIFRYIVQIYFILLLDTLNQLCNTVTLKMK
jgi:hypothetical protein